MEVYEHSDIVAVRDSAYFFACTVGLMLIPRVVIWVFQGKLSPAITLVENFSPINYLTHFSFYYVFMNEEFCTINVIELDDVSTSMFQV